MRDLLKESLEIDSNCTIRYSDGTSYNPFKFVYVCANDKIWTISRSNDPYGKDHYIRVQFNKMSRWKSYSNEESFNKAISRIQKISNK